MPERSRKRQRTSFRRSGMAEREYTANFGRPSRATNRLLRLMDSLGLNLRVDPSLGTGVTGMYFPGEVRLSPAMSPGSSVPVLEHELRHAYIGEPETRRLLMEAIPGSTRPQAGNMPIDENILARFRINRIGEITHDPRRIDILPTGSRPNELPYWTQGGTYYTPEQRYTMAQHVEPWADPNLSVYTPEDIRMPETPLGYYVGLPRILGPRYSPRPRSGRVKRR